MAMQAFGGRGDRRTPVPCSSCSSAINVKIRFRVMTSSAVVGWSAISRLTSAQTPMTPSSLNRIFAAAPIIRMWNRDQLPVSG